MGFNISNVYDCCLLDYFEEYTSCRHWSTVVCLRQSKINRGHIILCNPCLTKKKSLKLSFKMLHRISQTNARAHTRIHTYIYIYAEKHTLPNPQPFISKSLFRVLKRDRCTNLEPCTRLLVLCCGA